jgi:hypothetical protein
MKLIFMQPRRMSYNKNLNDTVNAKKLGVLIYEFDKN